MAAPPRKPDTVTPSEIAPGVWWLEAGRGLLRSNVYFVRSGSSWALIDAGSAKCGRAIRQAAAGLFGELSYPAAILLTHDHPDHAGSVRELAEAWDCFVWVHPDELPLVLGDLSTFEQYPGPLDRWVVLPFLHLLGPKRTKAMLERASFRDRARTFDPDRELPGLPGWEAIPTPGHTPGHTAFFRRDDRVLITGDAMVTLDLNSLSGVLLGRQRVSGPPWYTTWDWRAAKASAALLAELEPRVLAGGHGIPMSGPETPSRVRSFSDRFSGRTSTNG